MHLIADATDLARLEAARRHGFGVESRRVLAVCGERLALVEARDPDIDGESFHRFVVEEIDARHRFVRIALFEPAQLPMTSIVAGSTSTTSSSARRWPASLGTPARSGTSM